MSDNIRSIFLRLKENRKILRAAVVIMVIAAAVLLFGANGKKDTITLQESEKIETQKESETEKKTEKTQNVYVDVSGAVNNPGVYEMKNGSRIFEAVEKAGGLTENADTTSVNQAEKIQDGEKIYIPEKGASGSDGSQITDPAGGAGSGVVSGGGTGASSAGGNSLININQADSEELQKIPGVGPAIAGKIIDYRNRNGLFGKIEDIKNVSGIGDKTFEKMSSWITV